MKYPGFLVVIVAFVVIITLIITISFIGSPMGEFSQLEPTKHWCTSATAPVYETLNGPQSDFVFVLILCAGIGTIICATLYLLHGDEK